MSDGKIDYLVTLRDGFSAGLGKIKAGLGGLLGGVKSFAGGAVRMLTSLPTLLAGGGGLFGLSKAIGGAFDIETIETQFKVLLGSAEKAKNRLKELQDFSAATPFQIDGIAQASRSMHVFSGGVLGGVESLKLVGDAASATGQSIEDVGFWAGRAYAAIKNGQPFGETAMRLQEMGILTGDGRAKMEELSKSGADSTVVWAALQNEFKRFGGGMAELSTTGNGLISTLKDNAKLGMAEFGSAFTDAAKGGLQKLIDRFGELRSNGTFEAWGQRAAQIVSGIGSVFTWLSDRVRAALDSEIVSSFITQISSGFQAVSGMFKSLADGTTGVGKGLGELGVLVGSQLKLAFMGAINWLAKGLQASIAALIMGLGGVGAQLGNASLWAGIAQVIIGSLGAVGAFMIKIFTEPLVLMQAAIDTMIKGMFNTLAGAGGNRDASGTGRLGRKLGIGVQENDYGKNLDDARKNSWLLNTASRGANDSKDILNTGLGKVGKAMANSGIATAMADTFLSNMKGDGLFDTSSARADRDAAASAMARHGDGFQINDLAKAIAPSSSGAGGGAAATLDAAVPTMLRSLESAAESKRTDIDTAARFDWLNAVKSGNSPDAEIAANTRKISTILEEMKKDNKGIV